MTTLTTATAKTMMRDFLKGEEKNPPTILIDFVIDTKASMHDFINDNQLKSALEKGIIKAPKKTEETKELSDLERVKVFREFRQTARKAMNEKAEKLETIIKSNINKKPDVLFRLTWKKGKEGMDIMTIFPLADGLTQFIVNRLKYIKEHDCLLQTNIVDSLYTDNLKYENGIFQVYTNGAEWIPAEVEIMEHEIVLDEIKKDKPARPRKLGKVVEVEETKVEGEKEGE